jgi:hypothetical protein
MGNGDAGWNRNRTFKPGPWSRAWAPCQRTGIWILFTGMVFFALAGLAGADVLVMKNGDRLQGTAVSMSSGKLVFKTSYAGDITIKWEAVATLTTDEPFEAYLKDQETLKGKIMAGDDGTVILQPADGSPPVPVQLAQIKSLDRPKPPPGWEFSGDISAGASKETGNTNTEKYNLIGNLKVSNLPHVIKLYGEFRKEWSKDKLSKDNALGSATYERFLDDRWFVFGNATAQTDKFKDLDLLGNIAIGPGYQFWQSEQKNLSVKLAPAYAYEKYARPMTFLGNKNQRDYFAGYWALDFDMWFFDKFFQVYHHDDIVYSFQDSDNWVVRTRTGIRIPMVLKLFASFQFNYEYDNQPADGKKNYDQSWNFGLGWAF